MAREDRQHAPGVADILVGATADIAGAVGHDEGREDLEIRGLRRAEVRRSVVSTGVFSRRAIMGAPRIGAGVPPDLHLAEPFMGEVAVPRGAQPFRKRAGAVLSGAMRLIAVVQPSVS
jgi:hypothetical protein